MVQDNVTGLVWEMKNNMDFTPDYSNPNDADNTYTWCDTNPETNGGYEGTCGDQDTQDFIEKLNSSNFGGYNDWRMPTSKELASLMDNSQIKALIDPLFAATTQTTPIRVLPGGSILIPNLYYWSSTTRVANIAAAWTFTFSDISLLSFSIYEKTNYKLQSYYVRAVRGGQTLSTNRFVINTDTIIDTATCLQWQKATIGPMIWHDALAASEGLILEGYTDWRLPNINELRSLVDDSTQNPAIESDAFPDTQPSGYWSSTTNYWSSTTDVTNQSPVWIVDFNNGDNLHLDNSSNSYVRAVRGTQCAVLPKHYTLTISKTGAGFGTVASANPGIDCGADCTEEYSANISVSLTATAACWLYLRWLEW